ncbi:MAG: LON peptidase substrate-binding domain-containing protein, partial [Planctomycetota bacterium]
MSNSSNDDPRYPGELGESGCRILPLFPLPDLILFPGQLVPVHVFEPRYRQMAQDLLDNTGEIVLGTVLGDDQEQLGEVAPVQPVAGLGRLQRYQALEDGRYLLMILGEKRVRVIQRIEDQDYPLAEVDDLVEEDVDIDWKQAEELKNAIGELEHNIDLPEGTSAVQMSDLLIMITPMTVENRYELFSNPSIEDRVVKIIELQDSIRGDE